MTAYTIGCTILALTLGVAGTFCQALLVTVQLLLYVKTSFILLFVAWMEIRFGMDTW